MRQEIQKVVVDPTIRLSDLVQGVGFLCAIVATYVTMKFQIKQLIDIVKDHKDQLKEHDIKIDDHEKQINIWRGSKE